MALSQTFDNTMPTTLLDLLSNTLVLRQTAPYLPVSAIYALAATSKSFHNIVHQSPEVFRYLDLSTVKSAVAHYIPLDSGGISWRAERMDESLTEDEFYSGPLRGIFSKLSRRNLLRNVHTLVLDGLSVPVDLVREIIAEDRFNVRILSIREVKNLNERKLMQVLRYAVRPTRPEGTPKLKGLYIFGPREPIPTEHTPKKKKKPPPKATQGITSSKGAQIGAEWNYRSLEALNTALTRTEDKWYQSSGHMFSKRPSLEWAETIKACEGIIFFDAVLCRGPRHDAQTAYINEGPSTGTYHPFSYLNPAIATVALGPAGCSSCHSAPEGISVFGQSPAARFPLLSPPPLHSASLRAAQMPVTTDGSAPPPLIVRCEYCLRGRWCERCHKWWDETCYAGSAIASRTALQQVEYLEETNGALDVRHVKEIKIGVKRDCFGCGHTCAECKEVFIRKCRQCRNEYCMADNDASSSTTCDWCNYTARRTVEPY
ncbi:hypothetical protein K432DRAFT_377316 [Lepidopterella palustris CBS 459.81]|uniref:F-box domain-containing protein n=1 Tax=Lepidopterella palustris CBS 459.81 TaxID=1314670 RepID=A0A8E2JK98_9PEZI|nr:hypothetical protein K432DRAFT_377316 [Lepidopterella palustris CBS 459.81]